jgi:hypothetical protein
MAKKNKKIVFKKGDLIRIKTKDSMLNELGYFPKILSEDDICRILTEEVPCSFIDNMYKFCGADAEIITDVFINTKNKKQVSKHILDLRFKDKSLDELAQGFLFSIGMVDLVTPSSFKHDASFKKAFWLSHLDGKIPGKKKFI